MYYYYPCPKCGKSIVEWENDEEAEYDFVQKLTDATKAHFTEWHYPQDYIWTDEELKYQIKQSITQSQEPPVE